MSDVFFQKAVPVWKADKEKELHSRCAFFTTFKKVENAELIITGANIYKVYLNGNFLCMGPARSAHEYFRVDRIPLRNLCQQNTLFIEAVAYNTKSYYQLDEPGFIQAEICSNGRVVAWTGKDFFVRTYEERLQKVSKYSYQRAFIEVYNFVRNPVLTYEDFSPNGLPIRLEFPIRVTGGKLQERHVPYPSYRTYFGREAETGVFQLGDKAPVQNPRILFEELKIFKKEEWVSNWGDELQKMEYAKHPLKEKGKLNYGEYLLYDLGNVQSGFINLDFFAEEDSTLLVYFSEIDLNSDKDKPIDIRCDHGGCVNILEYRVKGGERYEHSSFEVYAARYIKLLVVKGKISVEKVCLIAYENSNTDNFKFESEHKKLNEIIEAARRTFQQNAVDIFTDCPSRERACWLCDSYFLAEAEALFTGENTIEYNFLENYIYAPQRDLPVGMIPMCYPADVIDLRTGHHYIPNWALFYIEELYQYCVRTEDFSLAKQSKNKIEGILSFFEKYVNDEGLLEDLDGWVFVEWSKANDSSFLQGVNYPTNMMYAKALESFGKMYAEEKYILRAEVIRKKIREDSFNGRFFEDNRIRVKGELKRTGNISETCQYYAFFTGVATPELYPELFQLLVEKFGPGRQETECYPFVYKSNAFIGNYLRLMILAENGETMRLAKECIFVTIFNYVPMFGIVIAFQEYIPLDGVFGSEFVGFKNFYSILFSPQSASYLEFRNTIYISLIRIATNFPIILIFTLLINEIKSKKAKTLVQGISYIPYFISWVCVGGMAYNLLKLDGGVFNQIIEMFGGTGFDWYAKPDYWWWILAASSLWKGMGWSTLIYISALGSIDTELYDACEIDGGGRYRKMVSVTLPGLMNMIMLQLILDIGAIMSDNYDQVMAMTIPKRKTKVLWLGDSITQGYGAPYTSCSYVNKANRQLGYEVLNQGIGGYYYDYKVLKELPNFYPDKIIVALGINGHKNPNKKTMIENYYKKITTIYPNVPILALTPLWCGGKEVDMQGIIDTAKYIKLEGNKYSQMKVIDGFQLVPHLKEYFLEDSIHPNILGMITYADNLVKAIEKISF